MKKFPALLLALVLCQCPSLFAQTTPHPVIEAFGKISKADLELTQCDFEKDANAEVLFDEANMYYDQDFNIVIEYHKRIKVFNEKGADKAKVSIEYQGGNRVDAISNLQAQTINSENGSIQITKVDKKQIFTQAVDKYVNTMSFAFPNVKAGSIIEYKYTLTSQSRYIPTWEFQSDIPTRFSQITTDIPEYFTYRTQTRVFKSYDVYLTSSAAHTLGTGTNPLAYTSKLNTYGFYNVPSLPDEAYMSSRVDNLLSISFQYAVFTPPPGYGFVQNISDTWGKIVNNVLDDDDFGSQMKRKLNGEEAIITKAKTLKTDDEKIAYVFGEVKQRMKWNGINRWYCYDGTAKAWEAKTGNSTEINLALYHLLKQSGVKVYPMLVSTRQHGKVNNNYTFVRQFNKSVVFAPIDSAHNYVLDASNKYNAYNVKPAELLNSYALTIDKEDHFYDLRFLQSADFGAQSVYLTGEIKADGKLEGNAEVSYFNFLRQKYAEQLGELGEEKYKETLRNNDNGLKIESFIAENANVDTLPLIQKIAFKQELSGSDGDYIYCKLNLFSNLNTNPFLAEKRITNIEFGYQPSYSITGSVKLPAGFKVDALPKNISMSMPDGSVTFKRTLAPQEDGSLAFRYILVYKKSLFVVDDYPALQEFYKKAFEMLNEPVALKKI